MEQEAEAEELKEDGRRRGEEGGAAIEGSLLGRVWGRNRAFGRLTVIVWRYDIPKNIFHDPFLHS